AGARRSFQSRRTAEKGHVRNRAGAGGRNSKRIDGSRCRRAARQRKHAVRVLTNRQQPVRQANGNARRKQGRKNTSHGGTAGGRQNRGRRQPVPAISEFAATLSGKQTAQ